MAVAVVDDPEPTTACGAALMADDPAVASLHEQIGAEVSRRIGAALGPGCPRAVKTTLQMTFAGAPMTARFVTCREIAGQLDEAVELILGRSQPTERLGHGQPAGRPAGPQEPPQLAMTQCGRGCARAERELPGDQYRADRVVIAVDHPG